MRLALAAVATLAALAAACGSEEQEAELAGGEAPNSARLSITSTATGADQGFDADCDGIADYAGGRSRLVCDYANGSSMEMIEIGRRAYWRIITSDGAPRRWTEATTEEDGLLGTPPAKVLDTVRTASTHTEQVGEEDVRGVSTTHYRLTVDREAAKLVGDGHATVDIWLADELLRRISYEDRGGQDTTEFFDFGIDVEIEPPPTEEVDRTSPDCIGEPTSPVTEQRAKTVLRSHGFSVESWTLGCYGDVAASFSNQPSGSGSGRLDEVVQDEGMIFCSIYDETRPTGPTEVVRRKPNADGIEVAFANLACSLFPDSPRAEEKLNRLEAAFEEIKQAVRP